MEVPPAHIVVQTCQEPREETSVKGRIGASGAQCQLLAAIILLCGVKSTANSAFTPPALLHGHTVQIAQGILLCPALQLISHTGSRLLRCYQSPRAGCFFSPFVLSFYPLRANPDRRNKQGARFECAGLGWSYPSVAYFGSWWHSS